MTERPKFFDDLAGVAGGALSAFSGLRDEMTALVRARVDETIRKLDLVRREEFEIMSELATQARSEVTALSARVAALEAIVIPAPPREVEPSAAATGDGGSVTPPVSDQDGRMPA
ncbi:accessory factor UbiK family protein [Acidiphilium sp.]|uniref:accessory factor UbiK family protein n=1 Tax=Acidiphilium sp. TaxID=527 RepID=UPI003D02F54A